jgi:hypothetical protein
VRRALVLWFGEALVVVFLRALSLALSGTARLGLCGGISGVADPDSIADGCAVVARSSIGVQRCWG